MPRCAPGQDESAAFDALALAPSLAARCTRRSRSASTSGRSEAGGPDRARVLLETKGVPGGTAAGASRGGGSKICAKLSEPLLIAGLRGQGVQIVGATVLRR